MQASDAVPPQPDAWSMLDAKRVNHQLTQHVTLKDAASQAQMAVSLTSNDGTSFTVKVCRCMSEPGLFVTWYSQLAEIVPLSTRLPVSGASSLFIVLTGRLSQCT